MDRAVDTGLTLAPCPRKDPTEQLVSQQTLSVSFCQLRDRSSFRSSLFSALLPWQCSFSRRRWDPVWKEAPGRRRVSK